MRAFFRIFVLISALFFQTAYANELNYHGYPQANNNNNSALSTTPTKPKIFGDCYLEIINDSFSNVTIYGRFDDGVPLTPFDVYSYEYSHLIDMFYNGYCHSGMYISVVTFSGYTIFSGYVFTGSTIHIVPLMNKKLTVTLEKHTK